MLLCYAGSISFCRLAQCRKSLWMSIRGMWILPWGTCRPVWENTYGQKAEVSVWRNKKKKRRLKPRLHSGELMHVSALITAISVVICNLFVQWGSRQLGTIVSQTMRGSTDTSSRKGGRVAQPPLCKSTLHGIYKEERILALSCHGCEKNKTYRNIISYIAYVSAL